MAKETEKKINEKRYENSISDDELNKSINSNRSILLAEIFEKIKFKKENVNVLDFGCGSGFASIYLKNKFPKISITLLDHSENAIKNSKLYFKKKGILENTNFSCNDFSYEFKERFDFIFSNGSLHHAENLTNFLKSVSNNLNDEGYFYCQEPTFSDFKPIKEVNDYYNENEKILGFSIKRKDRNDNFFRYTDIVAVSRSVNFDLIDHSTVNDWSLNKLNKISKIKIKLINFITKKNEETNYIKFKKEKNLIERYFLFQLNKGGKDYLQSLYNIK